MERGNLDDTVLWNEIIPFYFGTSPKRLYGCHHLPQVSSDKSFAVVLCSPIGQEYLKSHRVNYQLAVLLSRAGFHVLRFDYFGCGDSEGDFEAGSLRQWSDDILTAIGEIQKRSGLVSVCLVGLRIGATLALRIAAVCPHVVSLVLWEPVLKGKAYVKQLDDLQREFVRANRYQRVSASDQAKGRIVTEILGFPITSDLEKELNEIVLNRSGVGRHVRLLVLSNSEESIVVGDLSHFAEYYPQADLRSIAEQSALWKEFDKKLIPASSLRFIVSWVRSVQA